MPVFPDDFLFQLSATEREALTSQMAMSKSGRGGRRTLLFAVTEHGALMAANILNSPRAAAMSVYARVKSEKLKAESWAYMFRSHDGR